MNWTAHTSDRLSELSRFVRGRPRLLAAAAMASVLVGGFVAFVDWGDPLTPSELETLRAFVVRTNSLAIRERYNRAAAHGQVTVRDADQIIEAAKAAEPAYGLVSAQRSQ